MDNPRQEPLAWTFNPYEVALVGYQNSGKTTLAAGLVSHLPHRLAYVKHDVHRFEMDHPGKDTHTLSAAGAGTVFISDPRSRALVRRQPLDPVLSKLDLLEEDGVLVEGHKKSSLPKIVVLDEALTIVNDPAWEGTAPLAAVGPWGQAPDLPWPVPYFCRDEVASVAEFITAHWDKVTAQRPVYGLVLTGGRSTRMGADKAALDYGAGEETRRVYGLLEEFCSQVFVSCRADQSELPGRRGLPQVHDQFLGLGPLSGILSALQRHPGAAWLVVACDLPRLDREVLAALVAGRNPFRFATAFRGYQGFPEPLCALYEPKSRPRLLQFLAAGHDCPRKMLINSPVTVLDPPGGDRLANINTPDERQEVLRDQRR